MKRLVPIASHIIATEELPADLIRELCPKGRTFSETRRVLHYYRLSPDGKRVIWVGGYDRITKLDADTFAVLGVLTVRPNRMRKFKLDPNNVDIMFFGSYANVTREEYVEQMLKVLISEEET